MTIISIKIKLVEGKPDIKAYASVHIGQPNGKKIALNDLRVVQTQTGLAAWYPNSPYRKGSAIYCPLDNETRLMIEEAVLKEYWEVKKARIDNV